MPTSVDLTPVPRFDISLIRYLNSNFSKLRDALLGLPKIASGRQNVVFSSQAAVNAVVSYGKTFAFLPATVGCMEDGFAAECSVEIVSTSTSGCTFRCFSPKGTLYTGTMVLAWHAIEGI